ncbi:MAG: MFS transporter [Candidatus Gracilibacteria bacterium]
MGITRINQILNIAPKEWSRVLVAWSQTFLSRVGYTVGWTILLATFLSKIGIEWLPALFMTNAVFVMLGTLIFRPIANKIRKELLITITVILGSTFLVTSIIFINAQTPVFFLFFLIAQGVFMSQLNILISLFNEELFSPLESQRTFPVIESAESVGGIVGGFLLSTLSFQIPAYKFIIFWVLLLLLILPIVLKYNSRTMEIPKVAEEKHEDKKTIGNTLKEIRKIPFLKALVIVVALEWAIVNIVEFEYTKSVEQNIFETEEQTLVQENQPNNVHLASEGQAEQVDQTAKLHTEQLTQKLGTLNLIFSSFALLMQLIVASRILTGLGVIASMMLNPLLLILNTVLMTLRFNLATASITRGSFELTNILFKNAYDSSYYAIPHSQRTEIKELLQGIVKPLGAVFGTGLLLIIASMSRGLTQTLTLNGILIGLSIIMAIIIEGMGRKYTSMSEQHLGHKTDLATRLNAIEILGQKGHAKALPTLQKLLCRPQEPMILKETILKTMAMREETNSLSSILEILKDENPALRLCALHTLSGFKDLKEHLLNQSFTKYRVIQTLKQMLKTEDEDLIREELIKRLFDIAPEELTVFTLESIEKNEGEKAGLIRALRLFNDPNLPYYLEPYLDEKNPQTRGASIVALWQFTDLRRELEHHLNQMLGSKNLATLESAIETAGKVQFKEAKLFLRDCLRHESQKIREKSLLALAQMEDELVISDLVRAFLDPKHQWFNKSYAIMNNLPKRFKETLENTLYLHTIDTINILLSKKKNGSILSLGKETLGYLKSLYQKLSAWSEANKIEKLLNSTKEEL